MWEALTARLEAPPRQGVGMGVGVGVEVGVS
jgi:hypothetical protein